MLIVAGAFVSRLGIWSRFVERKRENAGAGEFSPDA
jgi:hypothetical protein